jgi:hypothetical protein
LAATHHLLGIVFTEEGQYDHARESFLLSIGIATASDQRIASQYRLAILEARRDRLEEAEGALLETLEAARRSHFDEAQGTSLYALIRIACRRGRLEWSAQYLTQAITIYERLGSRSLDRARQSLQELRAALQAGTTHMKGC